MKKLPFLLLTAGLIASLACDRMLNQRRKTSYVPWQEGLTLIFENFEDPSMTPEQRLQERIQRRVSTSKETPNGRRVTITETTLKSNGSMDYWSKDGSWVVMQGDTPLIAMLPEGFPNSTDHWEYRRADGSKVPAYSFQIIGRGALQNPDLKLPDDFDRIGVWVEMTLAGGSKYRFFYLPDIGEEESWIFKNGQWALADRLISRGFTDAPPVKTDANKP